MLKTNKPYQLYPAKISFKNEGEIQNFAPTKAKTENLFLEDLSYKKYLKSLLG